MPDKDITEAQRKAIYDWAWNKGAQPVHPNRYGYDVLAINSEPLVLYRRTVLGPNDRGATVIKESAEHILCSDNQARELEELGIVMFTATQQELRVDLNTEASA